MGSPKCEHATETTQYCVVCTAEAFLQDLQTAAQTELAQSFPRSSVELRILEALQQTAPRAVTANRIATLLGLARQEAQTVLYALALLGTVIQSEKGYYRSRPLPEERMQP